MNRRSIQKLLFFVAVPASVVCMFALSACELIVDFDRTRIDAGQNEEPDAQPGPETGAPDQTSPPVEAGPDAEDDASDAGIEDAQDDG